MRNAEFGMRNCEDKQNCENKVKEMCADCGRVFIAGPNAFLCPDCIKRRLREGIARRNRREQSVPQSDFCEMN